MQEAFDLVVPPSRRSNINCYAKSNAKNFVLQQLSQEDKHEVLGSVEQFKYLCSLMNYPGDDRYFKLNILAFEKHGTFEFRQHAGTTDFIKISYWIRLLVKFCSHAKVVPPGTSIVKSTNPHEKLKYLLKHVIKDGALTDHFLARAAAFVGARSEGKYTKSEKKDTKSEKIKRVNDFFAGKSKLEALREMCENLFPYASPVGSSCPEEMLSSITQCKNYLESIYVNIFDYVAVFDICIDDDCYKASTAPFFLDHVQQQVENKLKPKLICKNRAAFRARCKKIGCFPKEKAKSSTLKFLLKHL